MRIQITTISLTVAVAGAMRVFQEGEVVEGVELQEGEEYGEDQIPLEVATARLAAGTAQPVVDGVTSISPTVSAVISQIAAASQAIVAANTAFLSAAETGTDSDKLALAEAVKGFAFGNDDQVARMKVFNDQVDAIRAELAKTEKPKRGRNQGGDA